jgi:hypothetical protein
MVFVSEKEVTRTFNNAYSLKAVKRGPIINGYVGRLFSKILYHVSLLLRESLFT